MSPQEKFEDLRKRVRRIALVKRRMEAMAKGGQGNPLAGAAAVAVNDVLSNVQGELRRHVRTFATCVRG